MIRGAKEKKERSLNEHLHLKGTRCQGPKCAMVRRPFGPGQHGQKHKRKALSDFGKQIKEKQKFKLSYGIDESNLRKLLEEASRSQRSTVEKLIELVERRLDNVIFRMGFAASRSQGRQLIIHGHVFVNKQRVKSPGFSVKVNDVIHVREESKDQATFKNLKESLKNYEQPAWLALDKEKLEGRILDLPREAELPVEINLLVESFNK
ncbi:MAG TPA: 30S ribosomal protein S4 [Candidatus Paceibacterota bacterium]|nr:30S ribosomal protein S4 [Candidatus Paceibacterota bacterium]